MALNAFDKGLLDGSIFDDPYPIYKTLREMEPICWSDIKQTWVITRYKDIDFGLKNANVSAKRSSIQTASLSYELRQPLERFYYGWLMYQDPPDHTRVKKAAHLLFPPHLMNQVFDRVKRKAKEILLNNYQSGSLEVVKEYGHPLALHSICELLGIPEQMYSLIASWSDDIVNFMQGRCPNLKSGGEKAKKSINDLITYLSELFTYKKYNSNISLYQFINNSKYTITFDEMLSIVANILMDGHEPIANAISNAIFNLAKYPDQLRLIFIKNELTSKNIDELLRYDPPFQYVVRTVQTDMLIEKIHLVAGQRVLYMIASANRDPEMFSNPDLLDLTRSHNLHRSFGFGQHYCLGASFAKPLIRIALEVFTQEVPIFKVLNRTLERHQSLGSRALKSLSVEW